MGVAEEEATSSTGAAVPTEPMWVLRRREAAACEENIFAAVDNASVAVELMRSRGMLARVLGQTFVWTGATMGWASTDSIPGQWPSASSWGCTLQ